MNTAIVKMGLLIRDLISYDEQLIRLGRMNYDQEDFSMAYIAIDNLGPANRLASLESYDGTSEMQELGDVWSTTLLIDFYANGAFERASNLSLMLRSQLAYELKKSLGIGVYLVSSMTDVKQLTGQQYGERIQLAVTVTYCESLEIETLRIDTVQLSFLTEQGYV